MSAMPGLRAPDNSDPSMWPAGAYGVHAMQHATAWIVRLPNGRLLGLAEHYRVTEHGDRTVTVSPAIEDVESGWRGDLTRGTWRVSQ